MRAFPITFSSFLSLRKIFVKLKGLRQRFQRASEDLSIKYIYTSELFEYSYMLKKYISYEYIVFYYKNHNFKSKNNS